MGALGLQLGVTVLLLSVIVLAGPELKIPPPPPANVPVLDAVAVLPETIEPLRVTALGAEVEALKLAMPPPRTAVLPVIDEPVDVIVLPA